MERVCLACIVGCIAETESVLWMLPPEDTLAFSLLMFRRRYARRLLILLGVIEMTLVRSGDEMQEREEEPLR
jgi:hypothetical protein